MKKNSKIKKVLGFFVIPLIVVTTLPNSSTASPLIQSVGITHFEDSEVSDNILSGVIQNAQNALDKEKKIAKNSINTLTVSKTTYENNTYDYITFDEQHVYFYEENGNTKPQLIITNNSDTSLVNKASNSQMQNFAESKALSQSGFISDGVGGKVSISQTGSAGSYLSTKLTLPNTSQVSSDLTRYAPYNYGGFEYNSNASGGVGSWAADMGLSYSNTLGPNSHQLGWKPVIILKQKTQPTKDGWTQYASDLFPDANNLEGQYKNGYKPGSDVVMYIWYNNNGKVRLKVEGTTISPTRQGTVLSDTHNITIIDSNASWNISKISAWKLLSTVVSSDDTGRNRAIYSNIKVDGNNVTDGNFSTPQEDHATVSRSGDTITINVQ